MGTLISIIGLLIVAAIAAGIISLFARAWIKVAAADEALIISGRSQKDPETGEIHDTTVIVQGRAVVRPVGQRHETISLRSRQVTLQVAAQSSDNVSLDVEAVALVKIGSTPGHVRAAAQRFASQDNEIVAFTQEQMEGALRGVIAQQSVVELMRERKKFSDEIAESIIPELESQGLVLDSFQIKDITDSVGYISSLGAPEIQAKRQAAEISQTDAERAIAASRIKNEEADLIERTELETNTAESDARIGRARAEARQAEALANEKARQQVLEQQAANRQSELEAEVNKVADAERYRRQQQAEADAFEETRKAQTRAEVAQTEAEAIKTRAEAEAEATRLQGEAKAAAIKAEAEALKENQEALLAQKALDMLPELMASFAAGYANVGSMTVLAGGGSTNAGSDDSVGSRFAGESAAGMQAIFESVKQTTGIDLADIITGRVTGAATGQAIGQTLATTGLVNESESNG